MTKLKVLAFLKLNIDIVRQPTRIHIILNKIETVFIFHNFPLWQKVWNSNNI